MPDSWPEADELAALHQHLCARDVLAVSDFLAAVLEPLVCHLRRWRPGTDEHACLTAAEDAALALVRNPALYDPAKRTLKGFLCMAAERDLLNELQKEARHHRNRNHPDCVELAPDGRNPLPGGTEDDLPSFDDPRLAAEIARFTPAERAVFELMRAGERSTTAYVSVLGIGHLTKDEQEREVKRAKDRITKRLQRAGRDQ
jgi:hypothetical protein